MAQTMDKSEDYIVTQVDGIDVVMYVRDIDFLTGNEPEIIHEGDFNFTIYGIGRGQQPTYYMTTLTSGVFAEVTATSTCDFSSCSRGMDLSFDFSSSPLDVSDGDYTSVSGEGSTYADRILINFGQDNYEPDNWHENYDNPDVSASINGGVSSSYCAGDDVTISGVIENQVVAGSTTADIAVTNEVSGSTDTVSLEVPKPSIDFNSSITIPEGTNGSGLDLITIAVNGNDIYTGSADVGASSDEVNISSIDVPDSVMGGDLFGGSVTVSNDSNCSVNVTLSTSKK